MAKTLKQLREEVATRLGFGSQLGSDVVQKPLLNALLQRSQTSLLLEFGLTQCTEEITYENGVFLDSSNTPFQTLPEAVSSFELDTDTPAVSEQPLLLRALMLAKAHYNQQDTGLVQQEYTNWERNIRLGIG